MSLCLQRLDHHSVYKKHKDCVLSSYAHISLVWNKAYSFQLITPMFFPVLCYHSQDATELGAVFIGSESHSYSVSESAGKNTRGGRWHCGITLQTPFREFLFTCEQEQEQREWLEALRKVISQPMTPEDYASETLWYCIAQLCIAWLHKCETMMSHNPVFHSVFNSDEANLRRGK